MSKKFNFLEKLCEISDALNANKNYSAKFMDKRIQRQSMRSLVMQNFDNYEEKEPEPKFGTPAQRLAYQRVNTNHKLK